jgi:hypothetical protein
MEITDLRRQLHSQESEYKSLVRSCKVSTRPNSTVRCAAGPSLYEFASAPWSLKI